MNLDRYRDVERRLWDSLGLAPAEHQVLLGRIGTTVRVLEIGEGPPVLFVHGGAASGANWAPLVARLDGFRCLLLDRPGCGLSEPLATDLSDLGRFRAHADALVADVLDGLDLPSADVVATSLGGHIALRSAAAHPDRIDRMVEFGYVPGAPLARLPLSMRLATLPGARRLMSVIPPTRGAVNAILRQLGMGDALADGRISPEMVDWFHALLRDTPTMRNETSYPAELIRKAGTGPPMLLPELLGSIRCPVWFAWGEDDVFAGADAARAFVSPIPGARLELWAGTGHAPWMEHPDRAAALIAGCFGADAG